MCEQSESSTKCKDKLLVSMSLQVRTSVPVACTRVPAAIRLRLLGAHQGMEDEQEHLTIGQACVEQKSGGCKPQKGYVARAGCHR